MPREWVFVLLFYFISRITWDLPVKHAAQSYLQKFTIINLKECNLLKFLKYDVYQLH